MQEQYCITAHVYLVKQLKIESSGIFLIVYFENFDLKFIKWYLAVRDITIVFPQVPSFKNC